MLGLGINEAEEIKVRHVQGELSQGARQKIRQLLKKDVEIWLSGVELALDEFHQGTDSSLSEKGSAEFFPHLIFLCGGGSLLPEIGRMLKNEKIRQNWLEKFPFSQTPKISFIRPIHINNLIDQTGILEGPADITPMALASLTLEIATDQKKVLPPILRRVIRIMR